MSVTRKLSLPVHPPLHDVPVGFKFHYIDPDAGVRKFSVRVTCRFNSRIKSNKMSTIDYRL